MDFASLGVEDFHSGALRINGNDASHFNLRGGVYPILSKRELRAGSMYSIFAGGDKAEIKLSIERIE